MTALLSPEPTFDVTLEYGLRVRTCGIIGQKHYIRILEGIIYELPPPRVPVVKCRRLERMDLPIEEKASELSRSSSLMAMTAET